LAFFLQWNKTKRGSKSDAGVLPPKNVLRHMTQAIRLGCDDFKKTYFSAIVTFADGELEKVVFL